MSNILKMRTYHCLAIAAMMASSVASAATWNVLRGIAGQWKGWNPSDIYFFDADSVDRTGNTVTLWIENVKQQFPTVSIGGRYTFDCTARTLTISSGIMRDISWQTIHVDPPSAPLIQSIIPDTPGERELKIVCVPDFPKNTSGDAYFRVPGNSIFNFSADIFKRNNGGP